MNNKKSFKDLYEEKIATSKEEYLRSEMDRISRVIEDQDEEIVVKKSLSLPKKILSYILGCATAFLAENRDIDIVKNNEFYQKFPDEDETNIRANLSNLKSRFGFIEKVDSGEYRIIYPKVSSALDYILEE